MRPQVWPPLLEGHRRGARAVLMRPDVWGGGGGGGERSPLPGPPTLVRHPPCPPLKVFRIFPPLPSSLRSQAFYFLCTKMSVVPAYFCSQHARSWGTQGSLYGPSTSMGRETVPALSLSSVSLRPSAAASRRDRHSRKEQLGGVRGPGRTSSQPRAGGATQRPGPVTDARSHLGRSGPGGQVAR